MFSNVSPCPSLKLQLTSLVFIVCAFWHVVVVYRDHIDSIVGLLMRHLILWLRVLNDYNVLEYTAAKKAMNFRRMVSKRMLFMLVTLHKSSQIVSRYSVVSCTVPSSLGVTTVDGRNPASSDRWFFPSCTWVSTHPFVMQEFVHPQYFLRGW